MAYAIELTWRKYTKDDKNVSKFSFKSWIIKKKSHFYEIFKMISNFVMTNITFFRRLVNLYWISCPLWYEVWLNTRSLFVEIGRLTQWRIQKFKGCHKFRLSFLLFLKRKSKLWFLTQCGFLTWCNNLARVFFKVQNWHTPYQSTVCVNSVCTGPSYKIRQIKMNY